MLKLVPRPQSARCQRGTHAPGTAPAASAGRTHPQPTRR